jgi:glycine oxidase
VRLETTGPEFRTYVGWRDYYSITKSDGLLWAGSTEEHVGFNDTPTTAGRDDILTNLSRVLPSLADAGIEGHTACLRPLADDGIPIVGPATNRNNVYLATGTGRSGLLLAPGIAQAIADLIATGSTDWDIQLYSPSRFGAIA